MRTVYQDLARRIRAEAEDYAGGILPSMAELARRYRVSRNTVLRAAALLREEGTLTYGRGQRARSPVVLPLRASPRVSSAQRLAAALLRRIEHGELRTGQYIPKLSVLARQMSVSPATAVTGLRLLETRNLIHKSGRSWIVGRNPSQAGLSTTPVILILQDRKTVWRGLASSERTERFCYAFSTEAETLGVRLTTAFTGDIVPVPERAPAGIEQISSLVASLGARYTGTLIAATMRTDNLRWWVRSLSGLGRPVVWLDQYGVADSPGPEHQLFSRCHFSEQAAARTACEALAAHGHRIVLYPLINEAEQPWKRRRLECIRAVAAGLGMRVVCSEIALPHDIDMHGPEPWWWAFIREELAAALRHHPEVTGVIASRDLEALRYYLSFTQLGIGVPEDLSLISFDNRPYLQVYPVSSIDFGFGFLGYAAFHAIMRDIPLQRDSDNGIRARPRVVDRGSIGPPRQGRLRLAER